MLSFALGLSLLIQTIPQDPLSCLKAIVEINSGSQNQLGIERAASWLTQYFASIDIQLSWNFFDRSLYGATKPNEPKGTILLVGHLDTVFEETHPFQNLEVLHTPHTLGPVLRGPGVGDAKGGLILIHELLKNSSIRDQYEIRVFIAADEETGSKLSRPSLLDFARGSDLAIVLEPGWIKGSNILIPKTLGGSLLLRFSVKGPEGHIATSTNAGIGAADYLLDLIQGMTRFRSSDASVNIFDLKSESKSNLISGLASAQVAVRYHDAQMTQQIKAYIEDFERQLPSGIQFEYELKHSWHPIPLLSDAHMAIAQNAARQLAQPIPQPARALARGASAFLAAEGIPVFESMGPLGEHFHSSDELIYWGSLEMRLKFIEELIRLNFTSDQTESE